MTTTIANLSGGGGAGGGGAVEIKEKMAKMRAQTVELNNKREQLEKEKELKEESCLKSDQKRKELLLKYEETEERLRKSEEKLKTLMEQVNDAEVFLEESENFQRFLSNDSIGEDAITRLTEELKCRKDAYDAAAKRCRKAEKRKVKLTRQNEAANNHLKESLKQIEALKLKLEYWRIDEARKSTSCEKQMKIAEECKKNYESLDAALKDVSKRKAEGYEKIVSLKERILEVEEELEDVHQNRTDAELRTRDIKLYGCAHKVY